MHRDTGRDNVSITLRISMHAQNETKMLDGNRLVVTVATPPRYDRCPLNFIGKLLINIYISEIKNIFNKTERNLIGDEKNTVCDRARLK